MANKGGISHCDESDVGDDGGVETVCPANPQLLIPLKRGGATWTVSQYQANDFCQKYSLVCKNTVQTVFWRCWPRSQRRLSKGQLQPAVGRLAWFEGVGMCAASCSTVPSPENAVVVAVSWCRRG
jgi:hypothetical protein